MDETVYRLDDPRLSQRFRDKVVVNIDTGCWLWRGGKTANGHAIFQHDAPDTESGRCGAAHRYVYRALKGDIPEGMSLDHRCEVKHCVNPAHLEPVTPRENGQRNYRKVGRYVEPGPKLGILYKADKRERIMDRRARRGVHAVGAEPEITRFYTDRQLRDRLDAVSPEAIGSSDNRSDKIRRLLEIGLTFFEEKQQKAS